MDKSKVIIFGLGRFAEYASYVISHDTNYKVYGFCVDKKYVPKNVTKFAGLQIFDFEDLEQKLPPSEYRLFIAVGNNYLRERIFNASKDKGYSFISYISSKAVIWKDLKYGENVFLSEDTGIQPFVSIGDNTIIIGSKIGHHSIIGQNVLLSICYLAGNVKVGDNSFLGLNSAVQQNTIIGQNNIIGMGCIIEKDTNDGEVYSNAKTTIKRAVSSERLRDRFLL